MRRHRRASCRLGLIRVRVRVRVRVQVRVREACGTRLSPSSRLPMVRHRSAWHWPRGPSSATPADRPPPPHRALDADGALRPPPPPSQACSPSPRAWARAWAARSCGRRGCGRARRCPRASLASAWEEARSSAAWPPQASSHCRSSRDRSPCCRGCSTTGRKAADAPAPAESFVHI